MLGSCHLLFIIVMPQLDHPFQMVFLGVLFYVDWTSCSDT